MASEPPSASASVPLLQQLSLGLESTYWECKQRRDQSGQAAVQAPQDTLVNGNARRILTKKAQPVGNGGLDNEDRNLIVRVRDVLRGEGRSRRLAEYVVLDLLGQGTFGQVFRCQNLTTKEVVAVKVIRNHPSYYKQAIVEVQITAMLNAAYSAEHAPHLVRLVDNFECKRHLCLVFELLSINLYELIAENNFNGFPLGITRGFLEQILHGLMQLEDLGVIHCDLKPENILLAGQGQLWGDVVGATGSGSQLSRLSAQIPFIKIVDFGSACMENETVYSYIQSRFYRSPEVILGIPYNGAIDMWSLGCIAVEMFLGLPLFPGVSEHEQLRLFEETFGELPQSLLKKGKNVMKYFNLTTTNEFVLKTPDEFARDTQSEVQNSKKYFKYSTLDDMIHAYPYTKGLSSSQILHERERRDAFLHFIKMLLRVDPALRWTARDAIHHPFITQERFVIEAMDMPQINSITVSGHPTLPVAPLPSSLLINPGYPHYTPGVVGTWQTEQQHDIWGPNGLLNHSATHSVSSGIRPHKNHCKVAPHQSRPHGHDATLHKVTPSKISSSDRARFVKVAPVQESSADIAQAPTAFGANPLPRSSNDQVNSAHPIDWHWDYNHSCEAWGAWQDFQSNPEHHHPSHSLPNNQRQEAGKRRRWRPRGDKEGGERAKYVKNGSCDAGDHGTPASTLTTQSRPKPGHKGHGTPRRGETKSTHPPRSHRLRKSPKSTAAKVPTRNKTDRFQDPISRNGRQGAIAASTCGGTRRDETAVCSVEDKFSSAMSLAVSASALTLPT